MSRTWERRPKRRIHPHGHQTHIEWPLRACCDTDQRHPHSRTCRRDPTMCGVKAAFSSQPDADRHGAKLESRTDFPWRAYECPFCGLWHLTTTPPM